MPGLGGVRNSSQQPEMEGEAKEMRDKVVLTPCRESNVRTSFYWPDVPLASESFTGQKSHDAVESVLDYMLS